MRNKTTYNRSMHDKTHPYTLISAELLNNSELTGEERFLLMYLLGRSNDYILNSSYFAQKSKELFGWGRDKFQKYWNSLQEKGYIVKEQIREKGQAAGYHYKVYEVLKNRCPENPGSGESGFRQTSALPSIDKPNIDKPITVAPSSACGSTSTNLNGEIKNPAGGKEAETGIIEMNEQIQDVFNLICDLNPGDFTDKWKLNDKDRRLIKKAIQEIGFSNAKLKAFQIVDPEGGSKPFYSVSYVFSEFRDMESGDTEQSHDMETFIKDNPELAADFVEKVFPLENIEKALIEYEDQQQLFDFIKSAASEFYKSAAQWKASDQDLEYCEKLLNYDPNIPVPEKLQSGLKTAIEKYEWRFGQIVYQAITAIESKIISTM